MKNHINYSSPSEIKESGARAFRLGLKKSDCPISGRTEANKVCWWNKGFDEEVAKTCKGVNCTAKRGVGHSEECIKEHEESVNPEIFKGTRHALDNLSI